MIGIKLHLLINFIKKQKFKILRDLKEEKSFYLKKADFRMKEKRTYRGR